MALWTLPAANQGWWTEGTAAGTPGVGVPGGIFQYLAGGVNDRAVTGTLVDITQAPYNADNTGVDDVRDIVDQAWIDASGPTVIYFPPGTYRFAGGTIYTNYKPGVTMRGAGPTGPSRTRMLIDTDNGIIGFSSSGDSDNYPTPFTGAKTKGSTTIVIPDPMYFQEGMQATLLYENEWDDARIEAGAAPVWVSSGGRYARKVLHKVTSMVGSTLVLDPPMVTDGTDLDVYIGQNVAGLYSAINIGIGFEDFCVEWVEPNTNHNGFSGFGAAEGCWIYNVHFLNWHRTSPDGSAFATGGAYRCEIRKCLFHSEEGSGDDGAIGLGISSSCLIVDNIFTGYWQQCIYANGNNHNCVIAYNYAEGSEFIDFHNAHPSLNLIEGNFGPSMKSDGYHGSSSHNTVYRNWLWSPFPFQLQRFKRNYVGVGNILGYDGLYTGTLSFGNPNINNGMANGFAGPTGLSDQEGEIDFSQPGYAENTYVIQASDIFAGDFWEDWKVTGQITTRISDNQAIFTVNKGSFQVGAPTTAGSDQQPTARWGDDNTNVKFTGVVLDRTGMSVEIGWSGGTPLPAVGETVDLYLGAQGWQERDLDVQASSIIEENYIASEGGVGSLLDSIAPDTLPDSFFASSKPSWFGDLPWPPFDPADYATTADVERIPAGYRNANGEDPGGEGQVLTCETLNVTTFTLG